MFACMFGSLCFSHRDHSCHCIVVLFEVCVNLAVVISVFWQFATEESLMICFKCWIMFEFVVFLSSSNFMVAQQVIHIENTTNNSAWWNMYWYIMKVPTCVLAMGTWCSRPWCIASMIVFLILTIIQVLFI